MIAAQKSAEKTPAKASAKATRKIPYDPQLAGIVIAFGSPKGGPGKSALSTAVAAELGRRCAGPVVLCDLDSTANASRHLNMSIGTEFAMPVTSNDISALADSPNALANRLNHEKNHAQFLILDTPGAIENPGAQFALAMADMVVIPYKPLPYELAATQKGLLDFATFKARNPKQVQVVVMNCPEKTSVNAACTDEMIAFCANYEVPIAPTTVRKSVAFPNSAGEGKALWDLAQDSSAKRATVDIAKLVDDLLAMLKVATK